MLTECPPTEIICLLQLLVRALEGRDILSHESLRLRIRKSLCIKFLICSIELRYILRYKLTATLRNQFLPSSVITARKSCDNEQY